MKAPMPLRAPRIIPASSHFGRDIIFGLEGFNRIARLIGSPHFLYRDAAGSLRSIGPPLPEIQSPTGRFTEGFSGLCGAPGIAIVLVDCFPPKKCSGPARTGLKAFCCSKPETADVVWPGDSASPFWLFVVSRLFGGIDADV